MTQGRGRAHRFVHLRHMSESFLAPSASMSAPLSLAAPSRRPDVSARYQRRIVAGPSFGSRLHSSSSHSSTNTPAVSAITCTPASYGPRGGTKTATTWGCPDPQLGRLSRNGTAGLESKQIQTIVNAAKRRSAAQLPGRDHVRPSHLQSRARFPLRSARRERMAIVAGRSLPRISSRIPDGRSPKRLPGFHVSALHGANTSHCALKSVVSSNLHVPLRPSVEVNS